jgi:hypothetical protein
VITGAVTSTVHVTVREVEDVLPHASIATHLLVCDRLQLVVVIVPSFELSVGVPQASEAVAVPSAASSWPAEGLQPAFNVVPVAVITGPCASFIQVTVFDAVDVLPHASVARQVLVLILPHPEETRVVEISTAVKPVLQLSVTVGVPKAASNAGLFSGPLQITAGDDVGVITGGPMSLINVIVCELVAVFPHASVTVQVFVVVKVQPAPGTSGPTVPAAIKPDEQLSVTVAAPKPALTCACVGLQITAVGEPNEITGAVTSLVKVTVCEAVPVLPQASVAVHVFVTDRVHPDPVSVPTVPVAVKPVLQLSVIPATVPNAFAISVDVGLHITAVAEFKVMTGAMLSNVHVTVLEIVDVLLHPSLAVKVLVCDLPQLVLCKAPSVNETVGVLHASVAVAEPSAAVIADEEGLHPNVTGA